MAAADVPPASSPPSTPALQPPGSSFAAAIAAMAAAVGMTPQEFVFGGIAEVLKPMEERIADNVCQWIAKKYGSSAEIGKGNDALQSEVWPDAISDTDALHHL